MEKASKEKKAKDGDRCMARGVKYHHVCKLKAYCFFKVRHGKEMH